MNHAFPLALAASALIAAATPCGATTYTASRSYPARSIETVSVEFPAGDLRIDTVDDDQITVRMVARCRQSGSRCEDRIGDLRLISRSVNGVLTLELEGLNKSTFRSPRVELEIGIPQALAVRVEMGAGDLEVRSVTGDVQVQMGAGDVNLHLLERSVGAVAVNVGVGDATLRRHREPVDGHGFISKRLRWEGDGKSRVDVDLGVGDVSVALD
jgi:hypothetical protein